MDRTFIQTPIGLLPSWHEYRLENNLPFLEECINSKCQNKTESFSPLTLKCAECEYQKV